MPKASMIGQYDGDGRWMCASACAALLGDDLLAGADLLVVVVAVLADVFVLAVEELVEGVHRRDPVEVVLLRRAGR
jgi:hypothetical protein